MREDLGVHETLEIHELLTFKSLCLTKSLIMQIMVTDEELKKIFYRMTSINLQDMWKI